MTLLRGASTGLFGVSLLAAHVYAQTVPFITTTSLPGGTAGAFYSQTLAATSGVSPYKNWTVVSGSLPPGLTLNAATGNISGTPTTAAGSPFSFSVTVQDNVNNTSPAQSLSIAIIAAATPIISGVIDTEDNSLPPLAPGSLASIYGTNLASTTANVDRKSTRLN